MIFYGGGRFARAAAMILVAGIISAVSAETTHNKPPLQSLSRISKSAGKTSGFFPNLIKGNNLNRKQAGSYFIDAAMIPDAGEENSLPPGLDLLINSEKTPGTATFCFATAGLRPGAAYLVEMQLLRDHNIDGVYPNVSLFGEERRLSDFWTEGKPQPISLFFQAPPRWPKGENRELIIKVPRGKYRLWIEALSLKAFRVQPCRPARGWWFPGTAILPTSQPNPESIDFVWEMPETDRLLDITLILSKETRVRGPAESDIRVQATNAEESRKLSVPFTALSPGRWTWRIEVRQYRRLLATSDPSYFEILGGVPTEPGFPPPSIPTEAATPAASSSADFFPIGIYGAKLDDFPDLSRAGFNAVIFSPRDLTEFAAALEKAKTFGLKILASPNFILKASEDHLREIQKLLDPKTGQGASSQNRESLVLGWYLDDEPEGRSVSPKEIFQKRKFLQRMGFNQPGAIAINRTWRTPDYASAVDVFMPDPYPVPFEPLSWIAECLDEIKAVIAGDASKSIWSVIQAFDWNSPTGGRQAGNTARPPTAAELRAMTFLALIHDARGLFYYTYTGMRNNPALWKELKATIADVRARLPIIVAPTIEFGPHTFPAPKPSTTSQASIPDDDGSALLSSTDRSPSPTAPAKSVSSEKSMVPPSSPIDPSPNKNGSVFPPETKSSRSSVAITCDTVDTAGFSAVHYALKKIEVETPDSTAGRPIPGFYILSVNTLDKLVSIIFHINGQALALSYAPFEVKLIPLSSRFTSNLDKSAS